MTIAPSAPTTLAEFLTESGPIEDFTAKKAPYDYAQDFVTPSGTHVRKYTYAHRVDYAWGVHDETAARAYRDATGGDFHTDKRPDGSPKAHVVTFRF